MDEPLGPVAASLAAAIVIEEGQLVLPEEAVELARRTLLREPSEEVLVDIASLRAKTERVAGERGLAICEVLDTAFRMSVDHVWRRGFRPSQGEAEGWPLWPDRAFDAGIGRKTEQGREFPLGPTSFSVGEDGVVRLAADMPDRTRTVLERFFVKSVAGLTLTSPR